MLSKNVFTLHGFRDYYIQRNETKRNETERNQDNLTIESLRSIEIENLLFLIVRMDVNN